MVPVSEGDLFNEDEYVLCAYAARFSREAIEEIDGLRAMEQNGRNPDSALLKIRNIIADLIDHYVDHTTDWKPRPGTPNGQARGTKWLSFVEPLTHLTQQDHLDRCRAVLGCSSD